MIGTLVSLWLWALDNAQDGSLEGVSDRTIARVCDFPEKKAGKLMEALHKHGLLDRNGDHYAIHDWYDYAGKLMERREKDRKRKWKSASRQQEFQENSNGIPEEVHEKSCATVPYPTVPYPTVPDLCGGDGDFAGARAATDSELLSIGIKPGEYHDLTVDFVEEVRKITFALFDKYLPKIYPQPWDFRHVFQYCGASGRAVLLDYAFEQAAIAGKSEDWRYVDGIMDKLFMRGISTEAQARMWDNDRPDLDSEV